MYTTEKLLQMLTSEKASTRYDAIEWLRVRQESSPEIVRALHRATFDENKEVVERAKFALQADIHQQMAIDLGIIKADNPQADRKVPAPTLTGNDKITGGVMWILLGLYLIFIGLLNSDFSKLPPLAQIPQLIFHMSETELDNSFPLLFNTFLLGIPFLLLGVTSIIYGFYRIFCCFVINIIKIIRGET